MIDKSDTCAEIVAKYVRRLHESFNVEERDGNCVVVTPYLLPDNDTIEVVVRRKDGRLEISDMGTTLGFLYLNGVDLRGRSKQEAYYRMNLARYGVQAVDGEIIAEVPESEVADGISRVIEASKAVSYLVYTARARPGLDFERIVAEWLEENRVEASSSVRLVGSSGKAFTVDFVRERREAPPLYVQTLHAETKGWAKNLVYETVVMWVELIGTPREFRSVSLLDDTVDEDVWNEYLALLRNHCDKVAFWESKEELLEEFLTP